MSIMELEHYNIGALFGGSLQRPLPDAILIGTQDDRINDRFKLMFMMRENKQGGFF